MTAISCGVFFTKQQKIADGTKTYCSETLCANMECRLWVRLFRLLLPLFSHEVNTFIQQRKIF